MRRPPILLIAGTDTGVGKAWTGCALAGALGLNYRRIVAVKPIETGCAGAPSDTEDGVALARATGQAAPLQALFRFREPVAPSEGADREGRRIEFDDLIQRIREYAACAESVLSEGAGGLLSPLTWEKNAVDLARALDACILLVAVEQLGTIRHTLMALRLQELHQVELLGVVVTAPDEPDASTGSNAAAIARLSGCSRILCAPRTRDPDASSQSMQEVTRWLHLV